MDNDAKTVLHYMQAVHTLLNEQKKASERAMLLAGTANARAVKMMDSVTDINDAAFKVFSQNGEDGIIEWLVHHLGITDDIFIEFGVENYTEANTLFLMQNRNWRGLIIDGSAHNMNQVRATELHWRYDLQVVAQFIEPSNIDAIFRKHGFTGEIGLLSVDIDGNDYHVWQAIKAVTPAIVVCEYNGIFGDMLPISIPYTPGFTRREAHSSCLYFGCSLPALCHLAKKKGYTFVGSERAGVNAFFVRDDLYPRITGKIAHTVASPSRIRDSRDPQGRLSHLRGMQRLAAIAEMPVVNVATRKTVKLGDIADSLYSEEWLRKIG